MPRFSLPVIPTRLCFPTGHYDNIRLAMAALVDLFIILELPHDSEA